MPRGRYQQKQWETRQHAIVDALEVLSAERGFANVTMDDLAEQVGISKATLYQHFDSKDALLKHLMALHEDRFLAWLEETGSFSPLERLTRIMRYMAEGHIAPLRGLINLGRDEALPVFRRSPDLVARHDQIVCQLADVIRQGQAQGQIAPDLDPTAIISAMLALSNVSMGSLNPPQCNEIIKTREGYIDQMITLFERALQPLASQLEK